MTASLPAIAAFWGVAATLSPQVPPAPPPASAAIMAPASPAASPAASAAPIPAPTPPGHAGAGAYTVHLASYRNRDGATAGWVALRGSSPALGGLEPAYHSVEIPGRGSFVRITAGHFANRADALTFCDSVKGTIGYCQPMKG